MFFYIPLSIIIFSAIYLVGFLITFLALWILTKEINFEEFFVLSLMWLFVLPALLFGVTIGLIEKISNMLK